MAASKYDAFISYRRPDGAAIARQVESALAKRGVYPFLDLSDLCRGHFEFPLLRRVAEAPNFLVVLTPGALDRCVENGDWFRKEIGQAIKTSRNIIPLLMPGFQYPENPTSDLRELPHRQGVECSSTLTGATLASIVKKIQEGSRRQRRLANRRTIVSGLIGAGLLVAGFVGTKLMPAGVSVGFGFLGERRSPAKIANPSRPARLEATLTGVRGTADELLPPTQRITYQYLREPDHVRVTYRLPYLDLVRQGGPVEGLNSEQRSFSGDAPELLVQLYNGTERAVGLLSIVLKIDFSKSAAESLPVFDDLSPGRLRVINQGWSRIELPTLRFSIISNYDEGSAVAPDITTLSLPTIADNKSIMIGEYTPAQLRNDMVLKVAGTLEYGEPNDRRSVTFSTRVRNDSLAKTPVTTTVVYNAFLQAGQVEPVIVELQSGPKLEPGETATFPIRVRTDRTATTRLSIDFTTSDGTMIHGTPFLLEVFVPRIQSTQWKRIAVKRE